MRIRRGFGRNYGRSSGDGALAPVCCIFGDNVGCFG
ncbi:hypothetical protein GECvBN3_gp026 [Salmonella phage GEC_vB_N3]|uniref:Uncharacterized protein n=2 Tax=Epseptimavirus TaxID=2732017 RepID=A0A7S9SSK1_9CAUD|nr:hypothetical protein GECvBN3_gp026 [Salmonella phage GEC_vB_N3]QPI15468.1 hypothetical protein GECvBN7_gp025 [Salmonella phage GEC_vB_N7]